MYEENDNNITQENNPDTVSSENTVNLQKNIAQEPYDSMQINTDQSGGNDAAESAYHSNGTESNQMYQEPESVQGVHQNNSTGESQTPQNTYQKNEYEASGDARQKSGYDALGNSYQNNGYGSQVPYQNQNVNQYQGQYPNQNVNQYQNPNQYQNQNTNQYQNPNQYQYQNQNTNQYQGQYQNPNQYQNQNYGYGTPGGNGYQNSAPYQNQPVIYNANGQQGKEDSQAFGIVSLVLGIISLLLFCSCINIPLAIIGIIFGIIQMAKSEKRGMAIGGVVTATISLVLTVILYSFIYTDDDLYDYGRWYKNYYWDSSTDYLEYNLDSGEWEDLLDEIYQGGKEI